MGDVTTGGSSTTPNSPLVRKTSDTLLRGLMDTYKGGVDVYNKPLYTSPSSATQNAWSRGTSLGNSLVTSGGFGTGQKAAMDAFGGLGGQYGALGTAYDPNSTAFKTLRSELSDDVLTDVASLGASNGRYGSRSFNEGAAEGLGNALAGLDYGNMTRNIDNQYRSLDSQAGIQSGLFGMGQQALGNQTNAVGMLGQIGSAQDANNLASRMADYELFTRKHDADWEALARSSSILGGTAGAGGSTTSNTVPWWAALLGGAATGASILG